MTNKIWQSNTNPFFTLDWHPPLASTCWSTSTCSVFLMLWILFQSNCRSLFRVNVAWSTHISVAYRLHGDPKPQHIHHSVPAFDSEWATPGSAPIRNATNSNEPCTCLQPAMATPYQQWIVWFSYQVAGLVGWHHHVIFHLWHVHICKLII